MGLDKLIPFKKDVYNEYYEKDVERWGFCDFQGNIKIYPRFTSVSKFNKSGYAIANYQVESRYNVGSDIEYFGALIDIVGAEFNRTKYKKLEQVNLNGGIFATQYGTLSKECAFFIDVEENQYDYFFEGFNDKLRVVERYIDFKKHFLVLKNSDVLFKSDKYIDIFRINLDQFLGKRKDGYLNRFDLINLNGELVEIQNLSIKNKKEFGIQIFHFTKNRQLNINGKFGFVNNEGDVVIPFEFDFLSSFRNGVAKFCRDDKAGLITINGELILEEPNLLVEFSGPIGTWRLIKDGGIFFLDKDEYGEFYLSSFLDSFGLGREISVIPISSGIEIKSSFFNQYGVKIFALRLSEILEITRSFVLYKVNGKMGGFNFQGTKIFEPIYESIHYLHKDIFLVKEGDCVQLISLSNGQVMKFFWKELVVYSKLKNEKLRYNLSGYSIYIDYSLKVCELYNNLFEEKNPAEIFTFDGEIIGNVNNIISYPNVDHILGDDFSF